VPSDPQLPDQQRSGQQLSGKPVSGKPVLDTMVPVALQFRLARLDDVAAIVALVESAYRGDAAREGWTTEADLIGGQRTDAGAVADALAQRGTIDEQLAAQQALTAASANALRLSTARYEQGSDTYLNVLIAQRALYSARQTLVASQLAESINLVTLYAALGGGLNAPATPVGG